jgi:UDP-3-O-[3-hydroxymyristoyl] glucosamine N-acyltransferase
MLISLSVSEVVDICGPGRVEGQTTRAVVGLASLPRAEPGDLSFLGSAKYKAQVAATRASVVLVPDDFPGAPAEQQVFLRVANPSRALDRLCRHLEAQLWPRPETGIHPSACIDPSARLAAGAAVGPHCVIEAGVVVGERTWLEAGTFLGRNVRVGNDCRFFPGAKVLAECLVGSRVILHAGAVVGADGFGYDTVDGRHAKIPQIGTVILEDDVEVGANSTIDRARLSATVIREGTKIDNLVQIAHNVVVGRHCILCAQAGIAGTTTLEDYVVLGGQAGLGGHLTVGKGSMIGGGSGVTSDLPPGSKVKGSPPLPLFTEQRLHALRKRLPDLFKRVESIEEHLGLPSRREGPAGGAASGEAPAER